MGRLAVKPIHNLPAHIAKWHIEKGNLKTARFFLKIADFLPSADGEVKRLREKFNRAYMEKGKSYYWNKDKLSRKELLIALDCYLKTYHENMDNAPDREKWNKTVLVDSVTLLMYKAHGKPLVKMIGILKAREPWVLDVIMENIMAAKKSRDASAL